MSPLGCLQDALSEEAKRLLLRKKCGVFEAERLSKLLKK